MWFSPCDEASTEFHLFRRNKTVQTTGKLPSSAPKIRHRKRMGKGVRTPSRPLINEHMQGRANRVKISGGKLGDSGSGVRHTSNNETPLRGRRGGGEGGGWRRRALNPEAGPSSATREIIPNTSNNCAPGARVRGALLEFPVLTLVLNIPQLDCCVGLSNLGL